VEGVDAGGGVGGAERVEGRGWGGEREGVREKGGSDSMGELMGEEGEGMRRGAGWRTQVRRDQGEKGQYERADGS
jgi:hypothetical protein